MKDFFKIVIGTFPSELKENTMNFIDFLNDNLMHFERIFGYWKNQHYYCVKYKNECVCYILFNGTDDEKEFVPLTIWSDDSGSEWYKDRKLNENMEKIAVRHIDYCVHCGSCSGGKSKIIFGKKYENVCRTTFRFINPSLSDFEVIKE